MKDIITRWRNALFAKGVTRWRAFVVVFAALHFVLALVTSVELASIVAIVEAAVLSWVFVIVFSRTRWFRNSGGVHIMSFALFIALLTTLTLLPFDGFVWFPWIALGVLTSMAVLVANLLRLLWQAQPEAFKPTSKHMID